MYTMLIATADPCIHALITDVFQSCQTEYFSVGTYKQESEIISQAISQKPDALLLDLQLPGLALYQFLQTLRREGYYGELLLLSKPSDCLFLKDALKFGISGFLSKPLTRTDLLANLDELTQTLSSRAKQRAREARYLTLARDEIARRLVLGNTDEELFSCIPDDFRAEVYQTVIYESFHESQTDLPYQLHELLHIAGNGSSLLEYFEDRQKGVILLKGRFALERFQKFLNHYHSFQQGSPLDSLFLTYGAPVQSLADIHLSYSQAKLLISRRFFCVSGQHTLGYEELATIKERWRELHSDEISAYCCILCGYLQSFNRRKLSETMNSLREYLYSVQAEITDIKFFLSDLLLQIKETMNRTYSSIGIAFPSNAEIIEQIYRSNYLYEITEYFSVQFELVMNAIGNSSRESVFDDIIYYIEHNHHTNLKLESIASIFGYNSAYLGKIFTKKFGESFNSYIDKVRVNHAKELLLENHFKVYEIAEQVGYKNVDYFHKKFKKYVGVSPAEYRKQLESGEVADAEVS
ncbi:MAG: helix-turn-helix domain-containing protein [Lachnospiraceae bacterium]|nr:helix-turn-helix domain-containing protein [Lachnospiraceae bacterium]